jgi:glucokinase
MADAAFIGIEIGGTKLQLVAGDGTARVLHRFRAEVDRAKGGREICKQIEGGLAEIRAKTGGRVAGIGVGFGGPVDWRTGRIARSHQIGGWEGFPLGEWLTDRSGGAPVAVDNDANVGALGEALGVVTPGIESLFYVTLGSGVGGGLVTGGAIYHGAAPGEMEFGHLRLGRGPGQTVESRCSGWAVDARVRAACAEGPRDSALARLVAMYPGSESRQLGPALAAGDALSEAILAELSSDLAFALSHVVHLVHPDVIVLGGGLSLTGEPLRERVSRALPAFVMDAFHPPPPVRLAWWGEDAVPIGALHLAKTAAKQTQGSGT